MFAKLFADDDLVHVSRLDLILTNPKHFGGKIEQVILRGNYERKISNIILNYCLVSNTPD